MAALPAVTGPVSANSHTTASWLNAQPVMRAGFFSMTSGALPNRSVTPTKRNDTIDASRGTALHVTSSQFGMATDTLGGLYDGASATAAFAWGSGSNGTLLVVRPARAPFFATAIRNDFSQVGMRSGVKLGAPVQQLFSVYGKPRAKQRGNTAYPVAYTYRYTWKGYTAADNVFTDNTFVIDASGHIGAIRQRVNGP